MFGARNIIKKGDERQKVYDEIWDDYKERLAAAKKEADDTGVPAHNVSVDRNTCEDGLGYHIGGWLLFVAMTVLFMFRLNALNDSVAKIMVPERAAAYEIIKSVR